MFKTTSSQACSDKCITRNALIHLFSMHKCLWCHDDIGDHTPQELATCYSVSVILGNTDDILTAANKEEALD